MSPSSPFADLAKRLAEVFGRFPEVLAAYLFGSMAEGRAGPHSDLDLAVVPTSPAALLREHGYIDQALEGRWIRMIGFRNVLVHDYLEVDRCLVHRVLQEDLSDIRALAAVFAGLS